MLFAQSTWKESLRDIETSLQANENKLYHMGLKSIARSTISYRNNKVDSSIYEKLFYCLHEKYNQSIWGKWKDLWITTIALDSTLITFALSIFDRAKYRSKKWWVRVHVWLDISNSLPRFCVITDWKTGDNKIAQQIVKEWWLWSWEMIVFDRYYVDFKLWKMIDSNGSFFVSRTKTNTDFVQVEKHQINQANITYDATVELLWNEWQKYWKYLRVVRFYHKKDDRVYEYITNNFTLSALQIADIYKSRREIEVLFRWIKQNLKIKTFLWTSENAVKNQIWIAMIYYLLVRYLAESAKLWKQQLLKFTRIIAEKCLVWIWITELYVLCRSKYRVCLSQGSPPIGWLFEFV